MTLKNIMDKLKSGLARKQAALAGPPVVINAPWIQGGGGGSSSAGPIEGKFYRKVGLVVPEIRVAKSEEPVSAKTDVTKISLSYPLTPSKPVKGEPVYAYAHTSWNPSTQGLAYMVIEPTLTLDMENLLRKVKEVLQERLDVDFTRIKTVEAENYLERKMDGVLEFLETVVTQQQRAVLLYYIKRDFIGLGRIEPMMHDAYIEDISCDGVGIPIFVYHRNPAVGSVPTNVMFKDNDELDQFVMRLSQKAGKNISMAEPLVDAALPDGSRLQATLRTDIARRGSNFTIRKFTERPLTPTDVINFGTVDSRTMAYLWLAIEYGKSMLVSGGTATGKTSYLNILSLFIRPEMKIISIEDTPELRLIHPHWVPEVAREPIAEVGGKEYGKVDLFDLLKSSLRQRPDYIIVGEVRGKEAYVLFQQIATGHAGLSTIHAENMEKLMDRLTTEPINLSPSLVENLDVIIFLKREKRKNGYVRKVEEVLEVEGFDRDRNVLVTNKLFTWDPITDTFKASGKSVVLKNISDRTGIPEEEITNELVTRTRILEWMRLRGITDYRDVSKVILLYYTDPQAVLSKVDAELGA